MADIDDVSELSEPLSPPGAFNEGDFDRNSKLGSGMPMFAAEDIANVGGATSLSKKDFTMTLPTSGQIQKEKEYREWIAWQQTLADDDPNLHASQKYERHPDA